MEIKQEWEEFIDTMHTDMERFDKRGAALLYNNLYNDSPPDSASFEWAKAYVKLQQYASEFTRICISQAQFEDALIVTAAMEALNEQLNIARNHHRTPEEFVKEVKF